MIPESFSDCRYVRNEKGEEEKVFPFSDIPPETGKEEHPYVR